MLSAAAIILEWFCPAAGTVMANIMFTAPVRDVYAATRKGRLGDLNPTPWAFMLGNCCGWVAYSYLIQNLWVFFANAPGFLIAVWLNMQAAKLQYGQASQHATRRSIVAALQDNESRRSTILLSCRSLKRMEDDVAEGAEADVDEEGLDVSNDINKNVESKGTIHNTRRPSLVEPDNLNSALDYAKIVWDVTAQSVQAPTPHERLVVGMAIAWMALITTVAMGDKAFTSETKQMIVGVTVNLNLVFFYGAPLSTIVRVLKTRSSATVHIPTMVTNTANGTFWCAYGIAVKDYFIIVPNGLGAVLGVVQMVLCILFPRRANRNEVDDDVIAGANDHGEAADTTHSCVSPANTSHEDEDEHHRHCHEIMEGDKTVQC